MNKKPHYFMAALVIALTFASSPGYTLDKPNIVFMLVDNFGFGDLGSYGGGELRGAPTPALDSFAAQGLRLTNFNAEPECTPSRSAFLTGRLPIRSGTSSVNLMGGLQGFAPWEYTIAELLADEGYISASYGKWHVGDTEGRFPTDQGFDEWYGFPHSSNAPLRELQPGYDAELSGPEGIYEGKKGEKSRRVGDFDMKMRRLMDREITDRAVHYITNNARGKKPFFLYLPYSLPHSPPLPHPDFDQRGRSDYQNVLMEIDHNAGRVIAAVDDAGISDDTIVIFASDNGPESLNGIGIQYGGQSDSGPFRGEFPSAWEGAIRVPAIIRWPGRTQPGRVSNEIVSILDFYSTFAQVAGGSQRVPTDRPIDSINQSAFFFGDQQTSNREHLMIFHGKDLLAVKWRNYKVHFEANMPATGPVVSAGQGVITGTHQKFAAPMVFDVENDPKELWNINAANNWLSPIVGGIVREYAISTKMHPNLKTGAKGPIKPK